MGVTTLITVVSVAVELVVGMGLALIMRWALVGRAAVRTAILIPYGIVTVVAAYSWQYAWTPGIGYLANLLPSGSAPLTHQWPAIFIIILAGVMVWWPGSRMSGLLISGNADGRVFGLCQVGCTQLATIQTPHRQRHPWSAAPSHGCQGTTPRSGGTATSATGAADQHRAVV